MRSDEKNFPAVEEDDKDLDEKRKMRKFTDNWWKRHKIQLA